jgi:hypothetical protein
MDESRMTTKNNALVKKAELLMELRGFQEKTTHQDEELIDIAVAKPSSDDTVVLRVITHSNLRSNSVGVKMVNDAMQLLEENNIENIILFGQRFTPAAKRHLREADIEFFPKKRRVVSTLNSQELYARVQTCIDELCRIQCGHIPQSEAECKGYAVEPVSCTFCSGQGKLPETSISRRERQCPICGGSGVNQRRYSCTVRLLSDNADFHYERGWFTVFQRDLLSLLEMLRTAKAEHEEALPPIYPPVEVHQPAT